MASINEQLAAFAARLQAVEARQAASNPNDIIATYLGEKVKYGCKVTEGVSATDMIVALEGRFASDTSHWNPNYSASPTRLFQLANQAAGLDGAFRSVDQTATVATAPAAGTSRYDIGYIYVGPYGAGFAIATGTPSAAVKTDFIANGLKTTAYNSLTDAALPIGALPVARIYVAEAVTGIVNARIADLRVFA